jgi:nucleoside-diphosphate-sugar epimerase
LINLLTAIPVRLNTRRMAQEFHLTNRLRTEGTRNLLEAATANGVQRVLAEGLAYAYDPSDSTPADEDVPFWQHPPRQQSPIGVGASWRQGFPHTVGRRLLPTSGGKTRPANTA